MNPEVGCVYRVKKGFWVTVVTENTMPTFEGGEMFVVVKGPFRLNSSDRKWYAVVGERHAGLISTDLSLRAEKL